MTQDNKPLSKQITNADFINLANIVLRDGLIPIGEANFKLAKEYAKQEAIGFENWIREEGWVTSVTRRKYYQYPARDPIEYKTLEELYSLYLKSKEND